MPIYEYACRDCGSDFEALVRSDTVVECPRCHSVQLEKKLSVFATAGVPEQAAPMMEWTDRHCRHFHRLITRHARLYTEMVTTGALLHGDVARHLDYSAEEHPLALQL
ncbi:MAG: tRNA-dihydrouridine synthase, partial [Burkholderiales bacterium]|nr:tRNA-dihydrouridine synthase [Burkholderiales bacterium]